MVKNVSLLILLFALILNSSFAENIHLTNGAAKKVYGIHEDKYLRIPPPVNFLTKSANDKTCDIHVSYIDFSDEAKAAFEYAVNIWESLLHSDQVIEVEAHWMDLQSDSNENTVLGAAGASNFFINKEGLPSNNVFYNAPLAEKLTRTDLNSPGQPDIYAYFNKSANWYFGTDGETPSGKFDLVSVVLHELCHGLGFLGSMDVTDDNLGIWSYGSHYAFSFDRFLYNGDQLQLVNPENFSNPSKALFEQITGDDLYFDGPVLKQQTGAKARLYAPNPFEPGSSIDHLGRMYDDTENTLMTPGITTASSIHDPGPIAMAIMEDVGWSNIFVSMQPVPNRENVEDLQIDAEIIPDFDTDLVNPTLHYQIDNEDWQTAALISDSGDSAYWATIPLNQDATVTYYVSVNDKYGRTFYSPNTAPEQANNVLVGLDTVAPSIKHIPDNYFFYGDTSLVLLCNVDDLLGVDTVFVEYSVNGTAKNPVGLKYLKGDVYNIVLDMRPINLQMGDTITYRIIAKDKAIAGNTGFNPSTGDYQLIVTQLPASVKSYTTDFENGSNEFVLNGFDLSTAKGFSNSALNSKHPYENGGTDTWLDFTAELIFPIQIDDVYHYLAFDEIALVEPGDKGTVFGDENFFDYVIVEGSGDGGESWIPFEDGWDCRLHPEWEDAYNQSLKFNNFDILHDLELYRNHQVDLTAPDEFEPGDTIKVRFRLNSDPFAVGWGWAIDNLKIQTVGLSVPVINQPGILVYPNPVSENEFRIIGINDEIVSLRLYDFSGRLVYQQQNIDVNNKIVVPNSVKGLHILYLKGKNQIYRTKLLFK